VTRADPTAGTSTSASAAAPHSADYVTARPLQLTTIGCHTIAEAEPQALGLTYWFDAATEGEPYPVTIRFTGRRVAAGANLAAMDVFTVEETVERVLPGSGRIAITARVLDLTPGQWTATAAPVSVPQRASRRPSGVTRAGHPGPTSSGSTGFAPLIRVRAPGVRIGAWPVLVALGAIVALGIQALLATRAGLPVTQVAVLSAIACLAGLIGAKLYYLAQHPQQLSARGGGLSGMCLQGFVLAAVATIVSGALSTSVPVGPLLDATAPGLAFGIGIGRLGCFFGGCCAGRPTASRWGLWSSDRRLGLRRIPVQLMESALALLIGVAALLVVNTVTAHPAGAVFTAAIAAYTLGRQLLFPLRDLPRKTTRGRILTMALSGLVLAADIAVALLP